MKIKLFGKDIELIKVDKNAAELDTELTGCSKIDENIIYFDGRIPFVTLLHEIKHMHTYNAGFGELKTITNEIDCDTFGYCIEQLMFENGVDIFAKLKRFAEGKDE